MTLTICILAAILGVLLPVFFVGRIARANKFDMSHLTASSETIGRLTERLALLDMIETSYRANPTPQIEALWTMVRDRHEREM